MMPPAVAMRTYREHQAFYDKLQRDVAEAAGKASRADPDSAAGARRRQQAADRDRRPSSRPSVILISGCQDNQTSMDGDHNGAFTEQLLQVWNHGAFKGNYAKFHAAIKARMPRTQTPNLFTLGPVGKFLIERPFTP